MRLRAAAATVLVLSLAPALVRADALDDAVYSCKPHPGDVAVTFKPEVTLDELVAWASGFTCKNFLFDPRVVATGRKVELIAPAKMSPRDAYDLFRAALSTMGLAVVPRGRVLRIVEAQAAKKEALPLVSGPPGSSDEVVRVVVRPAYAKPETLKPALDALRSEAGDVEQIGSLLLVTDYASHVREELDLVKQLDVPAGTDAIYTIPVLHAGADKLAPELEPLLGVKPIVDARTNTLVLATTEPVYERAKALVDRLDLELSTDSGATIHVFPLGNAIAEEVAKTANEAISKLALESKPSVIADVASNKLIVTASARDYLAIEDVLRQLDEPRREVYIEALILEVDVDDSLELGTSAHGTIPSSGGGVMVGGVQTGTLSSVDLKDSLLNATGLIGGLVGAPLATSQTLLGTSIPSYAVLFQALASQSNTNVVSAPSFIAVDNAESKFRVGVNVPYKRGVVPISPNSPTVTTTNIDRQDLLLELDVTPHISSGDNVLLEIKHDSKELASDGELGPTWSTRGFETRVVVRDQQTVVLSGLFQERDILKASKVPILGDIPLLGHLFKYTTHEKQKSNLLVLLTPYVIKDQLDLQLIQERKQREHDEFVGAYEALDHMDYRPVVDYRHKRGVVEEIHRAVDEVAHDAADRAAIDHPVRVEAGPVRAPAPR